MPFDTSYTWSGDAAWLGPDYITTTATSTTTDVPTSRRDVEYEPRFVTLATAGNGLQPILVDLKSLLGESSAELKHLRDLFDNAYLAYSEGIPVNDGPGFCEPLEPKEPEEELNFDDILEQWK